MVISGLFKLPMENSENPIILNNNASLHSLFEQHYRPLIRFAGSYITEIDTCKDIIQDIFLALCESHKRFQSEYHLKAYLYMAVKNGCLRHLRDKKTWDKHSSILSRELESEKQFQDKVVEQEVLNMLIDEINALPDSYKKVYLLSLEGRKNQEIANLLGISPETVKSYKKKGKNILKERLTSRNLSDISKQSLLLFIRIIISEP